MVVGGRDQPVEDGRDGLLDDLGPFGPGRSQAFVEAGEPRDVDETGRAVDGRPAVAMSCGVIVGQLGCEVGRVGGGVHTTLLPEPGRQPEPIGRVPCTGAKTRPLRKKS